MYTLDDHEFASLREDVRAAWVSRSADDVAARRAEIGDRAEQLAGYAHRSDPQDREFQRAGAESVFLDEILGAKQSEIRRSEIAAVRAAAADPANREAGSDGGQQAPARDPGPRRVRGR